MRIVLLILISLFSGLAVYSAVGAWRIEQAFPPLGKFVEIEGVKLHYVDIGEGPAVVLIHGASSTLRDFTASILRPLSLNYRVIAFDRPGYGYSERPEGRWPDPALQASLIHRALQELEVEQPLIVGHSWSGSVVLAYLLAYPADATGGVLLAGSSHSWQGGVDWTSHIAGWPVVGRLFASTIVYPIGQIVIDEAIKTVFSPNPVTSGYKKRTGAFLALRPDTFRANAEDLRELSDFLSRQSRRYKEITEPVLLITGDSDNIVPAWNHAERLVEQLPLVELIVLKNTGHAPHHSHPDQIVDLIRGFAERVAGSG